MNLCTTIAQLLSEDEILAGFSTPAPRILQGSLARIPPFPPPLILISGSDHIPLIENETKVLAEKSLCTIGILAAQDTGQLAARIRQILATAGFRIEQSERREAPRFEWQMQEITASKGTLCP